jgi:transposase
VETVARPSKYSPATVAKIVKALGQGASYEVAAAAAGICYETLNTWRKERPEFSEALQAAEAKAEVRWLQQIDKAAKEGTWQAAAWKLERRYPERWAKRERIDLNIRKQAEQLAKEHGLDAAELVAVAEQIVNGRVE